MTYRIVMLLLFVSSVAFSQEAPKSYSFSLEEAVNYALDSSYTAINARRDVAKALKQKWETTADGLPQINGSVDYQNQLTCNIYSCRVFWRRTRNLYTGNLWCQTICKLNSDVKPSNF